MCDSSTLLRSPRRHRWQAACVSDVIITIAHHASRSPTLPIYLSCSISNKITRVINYRIPPGVACHPRGMGVRHGGTELSIHLVSSKPRSHPRSGFQRTISRRRSLAMRATPTISSQFLSILMVLLLCRQGIALPYLEPTPKRRKELSTYHTLQLDAREPWIDLQLDWR